MINQNRLGMKRNLGSCFHLNLCSHLMAFEVAKNMFPTKEIHLAIDISWKLPPFDKDTDMPWMATQDFSYFLRCVESIFKLYHWIPRMFLIRFLVSKERVVISPLTISEAHCRLRLASSAILDWLKSLSAHQVINFLMSSMSAISANCFISIDNIRHFVNFVKHYFKKNSYQNHLKINALQIFFNFIELVS